jgi:hypothetical protein
MSKLNSTAHGGQPRLKVLPGEQHWHSVNEPLTIVLPRLDIGKIGEKNGFQRQGGAAERMATPG